LLLKTFWGWLFSSKRSLPRRPSSMPALRSTVKLPLSMPDPTMTLLVTSWSYCSADAPNAIGAPPW